MEFRWEHLQQSLPEATATCVAANVRSKVQIILEKDLIRADYFVQTLLLVFVLVDIRKYYPAVDGEFGLAVIHWDLLRAICRRA